MAGILARPPSDGKFRARAAPNRLGAVTYRDENDALRAKVAELEGELDASRAKVAELSGTSARRAPEDGEALGPPTRLGPPRWIRLTGTFDHVIDSAGYEAIATLLRERLGLEVSQVGQRLVSKGGEFSLEVREGRTVVSLRRDWPDPTLGLLAAGIAPALFGGLLTAAFAHDLFHVTEAMSAAQMLWAAPLFAGATTALLWRPSRRRVESELAALRGTFRAVVGLAEQHGAVPTAKARVELDEREPADDTDREPQNREAAR